MPLGDKRPPSNSRWQPGRAPGRPAGSSRSAFSAGCIFRRPPAAVPGSQQAAPPQKPNCQRSPDTRQSRRPRRIAINPTARRAPAPRRRTALGHRAARRSRDVSPTRRPASWKPCAAPQIPPCGPPCRSPSDSGASHRATAAPSPRPKPRKDGRRLRTTAGAFAPPRPGFAALRPLCPPRPLHCEGSRWGSGVALKPQLAWGHVMVPLSETFALRKLGARMVHSFPTVSPTTSMRHVLQGRTELFLSAGSPSSRGCHVLSAAQEQQTAPTAAAHGQERGLTRGTGGSRRGRQNRQVASCPGAADPNAESETGADQQVATCMCQVGPDGTRGRRAAVSARRP